MQFLIRRDQDLALIEGRRRLAGQCDSVIANDINTHGWDLLIDPTAGATGDPHSRSVCQAKPVYSGRSYGNYWARAQPGIARTPECNDLQYEGPPPKVKRAPVNVRYLG